MQPVKGEEEKEGEGRVKKVRQTDEYNQHLRKEVRGDKRGREKRGRERERGGGRERCPSHNLISTSN